MFPESYLTCFIFLAIYQLVKQSGIGSALPSQDLKRLRIIFAMPKVKRIAEVS